MPAPIFESQQDSYTISTDKARLDVRAIHDFLANRSYWARGIPLPLVEKSIENSLCFGVYEGTQQIGFARVVSDLATFAWLADVFIVESHRGRGLAKWLMACIVGHPELRGLRRWMLATRDAHGLYAEYGFRSLKKIEANMEINQPDVYLPRR